jgi:hypothetical protein
MVTCLTCAGRFEPILADGTQYFHRCPALSEGEVATAIAAGKVALPAGTTLADWEKHCTDAGLPKSLARSLAAANLMTVTTFERKNLRDENLPSTNAKDAGKVKAIGLGTVPAPASPPAVVVVDV